MGRFLQEPRCPPCFPQVLTLLPGKCISILDWWGVLSGSQRSTVLSGTGTRGPPVSTEGRGVLGPDGAARCWQVCDRVEAGGEGHAWDLKRPTDVLQKSHPCCSFYFLPRNFLFRGFTWEPWAKISLPIEEDFFP